MLASVHRVLSTRAAQCAVQRWRPSSRLLQQHLSPVPGTEGSASLSAQHTNVSLDFESLQKPLRATIVVI